MPINISLIRKYVRQNLKRVHTISDVAFQFEMSAETLRKTFRRKGGESLSEYIIAEKLKYVKKQLVDTDLFCFEILYEAGFLREDSAARTFRAKTGLTMQQYRSRSNNGFRTKKREQSKK